MLRGREMMVKEKKCRVIEVWGAVKGQGVRVGLFWPLPHLSFNCFFQAIFPGEKERGELQEL